jgi:cytochrome c oxidase accessory protein FixG
VWLLIGVATGGAWIFYFADAPTLFVDLFTGDAHPVAYTSVAVLTATTFLFGGFAREQICIYACPWPRIQAAMMDDKTITVGYRAWRGEPRGKHRKREGAEELGDCIDCNACVAVCPMGIDIRDGQQLACITCALCIDACDDVMEKTGRPRGLIDYVTLQDEAVETAGADPIPLRKRVFRPRTMLYFVLWSAIGVAMVVSLFMRDTIDLSIARDRNPTYVVLSDGSVRNGFTIKVANQNNEPREFVLSFRAQDPNAERLYPLEAELQNVDGLRFTVEADKLRELRLFLTTLSFANPAERVPVEVWVEDQTTRERAMQETVFLGPEPEE